MKWLRILGLLLTLGVDQRAHAQTEATVTWSTTHQTIDGFGGTIAGAQQYGVMSWTVPTTSQNFAQYFYNPTTGLGYSMLRLMDAPPDDGTPLPSGAPSPPTLCTSVSQGCAYQYPDALAAQAMSSDIRIYVVAESAPAQWKSNGTVNCSDGGGGGTPLSADYPAFAQTFANYVQSMKNQGVTSLYAIGVSNEPTICGSFHSQVMSGQQIHDFVTSYLGPDLAGSGVLLSIPDAAHYNDITGSAGTCMSDSNCSKYVGITSYHPYDGAPSSMPNPYSTTHYWVTEFDGAYDFASACGGSSFPYPWCGNIAEAMGWAQLIDNAMTSGVTAFIAHTLSNSFNGTAAGDTQNNAYSLTSYSFSPNITLQAYVLGNYAKFIRPGWVRIGATHAPQTNVTVTAYKNASTNEFAIVATNHGASAISQTFSFSGFPNVTTVTPYTTSNSVTMLTAQSAVSVSSGSFSYALPAQSVTTFAGTDGGNSTRLAPPTGLTLVVR